MPSLAALRPGFLGPMTEEMENWMALQHILGFLLVVLAAVPVLIGCGLLIHFLFKTIEDAKKDPSDR